MNFCVSKGACDIGRCVRKSVDMVWEVWSRPPTALRLLERPDSASPTRTCEDPTLQVGSRSSPGENGPPCWRTLPAFNAETTRKMKKSKRSSHHILVQRMKTTDLCCCRKKTNNKNHTPPQVS